MLEAIKNRTSRRTFEKKELMDSEIQQINLYIQNLNKSSGLSIELLKDGSDAFSNVTKSYGMFTNIKSLILMKGDSKDSNLKEKVGYFGEDLILYLTTMGIGTCWVGGTFDKDKIKLEDKEQLICVIVLGKVKQPTLKEKLIRTAISKKRKTIKERLVSDTDDLPSWLINGIEAVRLAPSAKNTQKPMFEYKEGNLFANVSDDYEFDLVDLGIAKKHFEIAANGVFRIGNRESFQSNEL